MLRGFPDRSRPFSSLPFAPLLPSSPPPGSPPLSVRPHSQLPLRFSWASRRAAAPFLPAFFPSGDDWGVAPPCQLVLVRSAGRQGMPALSLPFLSFPAAKSNAQTPNVFGSDHVLCWAVRPWFDWVLLQPCPASKSAPPSRMFHGRSA